MADLYNRGGGSLVLTDLEVDGTTIVVDETNNRVGIGTATPASTLEIEGSSGDLTIEIDNNVSNSANLKITSGAGNARADFVVDGNNHLTMKSQRVAIVGTNPQKTLDVTGDGQFSTDLTVGGDLTVTGGDITYGATNSTLALTATAHDAAGASLSISSGSTTAGTSNNQAGGSLTISGGQGKGSGAGGDIVFKTANAGSSGSSLNALATALTISDDLSATFAGDIDVDGTANLDNTDIDGTLVVDGSNISLDSTSTLNIDCSNTSNGITIGTATSSVPVSIGHTTSETTVNDNLTVTGNMTLSGGTFSYANSQNAAISVATTGSGTDGKDLQIEAGSAPAGSANQNGGDLVFKAGGGDGTGTSAITFATKVSGTDAAAERMRLHTNGYLGIGTNAPSQLIHASGADPILVIQNSDNEHGDGQANSKILFGDHAGNALAMLEGAHSGASDDSKGKFTISTDNGSGSQLAMSIDDAQITTFSANVVVGGTTPKLTIGDAGTEDTMLVFDGNAADYRIGIDDGTDTLEIGKGAAHGTTPVIKIDSSTNCQVMHNSAVADGEYSGDLAMFTAGEDLTAGEVCYFKSDGKMWKAVATAEATARCVAMSVATTSADAVGPFLLKGFARFNSEFPTFTVGGALYTPEAETSSKNVPEQAAPDTDGDFVQVIGFAVTADSVYFDPDSTIIEVA